MTALPLFVEVLDRNGNVTQRTRLDVLPARIGRGYDCDVIVDDPFVAPLHAELRLDAAEELVLSDAGSRNGTRRIGHRPTAPGEHAVAHEAVYALGKTRLRIRDAGAAPAPERVLAGDRSVPPWAVWTLVAAALSVATLERWFDMVDEFKPLELILAAAGAWAVLLAWSSVWALFNRLYQGVTHFRSHLALAALSALAVTAFVWLTDITSFAMNWAWISNWRGMGFIALFGAVVLGHLAIANGRVTRTSTIVVAAVAVGAMALTVGTTYQTQKRFAPVAFMATVLPPSWRLTPANDIAQLTDSMNAAKARVDALRKENSDGDAFGE